MTGKAHSLAKAAVHSAACTHCSSLVVPFPLKPDTSGDFNLWGENWMLREESMLISVPLLAPLHPSLGFARGKEVKGFGDQESPPLCPCPRLSLCSVLGMSGDVGLKMDPVGRRRSPTSGDGSHMGQTGSWGGKCSAGRGGMWLSWGHGSIKKCRLEKEHSVMAFTEGSSVLLGWQADGCCQICITIPVMKALGSLLIAPPSIEMQRCASSSM